MMDIPGMDRKEISKSSRMKIVEDHKTLKSDIQRSLKSTDL